LTPTALNAVMSAIFICHQRAEFVTFTTLSWTILRVLVSLYLLHQGHGVISLVATFTGTSFLSFFNNLLFYVRYIDKPRWEFSFSFFGDMVRDLRTFVVLAIGGSLFTQSETIILSLLRDEVQVGLYSAAYKLITVWYIIPTSYMRVIFPILTQAYHQSSHKSHTIQEKSLKYLLAVALPLAVGGFAAAEAIIDLFYGPGFEESVAVFRLVTWHTVLAFVNNVFWRVLLARNEQRLALRVQVISGIIRIGLSFLLAPSLGSLGAAWALMGGYLVYTLLHIYYVRLGGTPLPLIRLSWRFIVAAAIMGAFTMVLVQQLSLLVVVFLAALIYAVSVLMLRAFSKEDWALFRQIWQRGLDTKVVDSKTATLDL
jgi:O-antigen/teichoic acid export membrane protein